MKFILLAILLLLNSCFHAQSKKYLGIGDVLPGLPLPTLYGAEKVINTSSYTGKLLVLDFWSLSCVSCIASFPKLDSLQKQFGDRLQILLVTRDPLQKVQSFFERRKIKLPAIPIIASDSVLSSFFYYEAVPHLVWINEQRKIIHITGGQQFSALSLAHYFSGKPLSFTAQQLLPDFTITEPVWKEGGGRLSHHVRYYSMLSGYLDEHTAYHAQILRDSSGIRGLKILNAPLLNLYQLAYGDLFMASEFSRTSRILLETDNQEPFTLPDPVVEAAWNRQHAYCYEVLHPPLSVKTLSTIMQQDLDRYFPYVVSVEKRCQRAMVLERAPGFVNKVMKKKSGSFEIDPEKGRIHFTNENSAAIASRLQQYFELHHILFVDSTNRSYIGNFSLTFPYTDWKTIAKEIEPYGFLLTEKEIDIDMLVIRDKPALPGH